MQVYCPQSQTECCPEPKCPKIKEVEVHSFKIFIEKKVTEKKEKPKRKPKKKKQKCSSSSSSSDSCSENSDWSRLSVCETETDDECVSKAWLVTCDEEKTGCK